jgi:hypothetical protein
MTTSKTPETPDSLAKRLKQARLASKELGTATDELNLKLSEAEAAIVGLNLGVTAAVVIPTDIFLATELKFMKHNSVWGLYVEKDGDVTPLLKCNRLVRVMAATKLADLLETLIAVVTQETDAVRSGISATEKIIAQLRGETP